MMYDMGKLSFSGKNKSCGASSAQNFAKPLRSLAPQHAFCLFA
jgi:hypothetical protein